MEKNHVTIAIRRVFDEEGEKADFFVEVYDEEQKLLHKKQKDNLEEAKELAEFGYIEEYEVQDIRFLFEKESIRDEKFQMISTEPHFYHYRFNINDFEVDLKNWLKYEKGWVLPFSFEYEGADEGTSLGSLYMEIDYEELDNDTYNEMCDWYDSNMESILEPILEEMFDARGVTYDVNIWETEIYIYVPVRKSKTLLPIKK